MGLVVIRNGRSHWNKDALAVCFSKVNKREDVILDSIVFTE